MLTKRVRGILAVIAVVLGLGMIWTVIGNGRDDDTYENFPPYSETGNVETDSVPKALAAATAAYVTDEYDDRYTDELRIPLSDEDMQALMSFTHPVPEMMLPESPCECRIVFTTPDGEIIWSVCKDRVMVGARTGFRREGDIDDVLNRVTQKYVDNNTVDRKPSTAYFDQFRKIQSGIVTQYDESGRNLGQRSVSDTAIQTVRNISFSGEDLTAANNAGSAIAEIVFFDRYGSEMFRFALTKQGEVLLDGWELLDTDGKDAVRTIASVE